MLLTLLVQDHLIHAPKALVIKMMNNAPICSPILNWAFGSSPPPPQVGFAETSGEDVVVVALSRTCRATKFKADEGGMSVEFGGLQMKMEKLMSEGERSLYEISLLLNSLRLT